MTILKTKSQQYSSQQSHTLCHQRFENAHVKSRIDAHQRGLDLCLFHSRHVVGQNLLNLAQLLCAAWLELHFVLQIDLTNEHARKSIIMEKENKEWNIGSKRRTNKMKSTKIKSMKKI
jgi:hypothetical protein